MQYFQTTENKLLVTRNFVTCNYINANNVFGLIEILHSH
jgi:hypothetical protein